MKFITPSFIAILFSFSCFSQAKNPHIHTPDPTKTTRIVDAACGECQFKMEGKSCDLAVRIDGKSYFVDGTNIDDHGDAHSKEGFCNAVRKAEVQGEIKNDRFVATYFKLVEQPAKKKVKKS